MPARWAISGAVGGTGLAATSSRSSSARSTAWTRSTKEASPVHEPLLSCNRRRMIAAVGRVIYAHRPHPEPARRATTRGAVPARVGPGARAVHARTGDLRGRDRRRTGRAGRRARRARGDGRDRPLRHAAPARPGPDRDRAAGAGHPGRRDPRAAAVLHGDPAVGPARPGGWAAGVQDL